eukprot:TRINITY_DN2843_c0_g1_i6.p1 TRINITY_DN2843_c0_g1~~TRINITY_DN2843_c0_g1_i6.p1  ORF type:complete len:487 (-),score=139.66 TRINITY_DN2843_c0_g1_i6:535-1995(-)
MLLPGFSTHPAMLIEHQYAISEALPQIQALPHRLPVLRDLAGSSYIRQEGQGLLIGPYEPDMRQCSFPGHTGTAQAPPGGFGMELFGEDLERITDNLMAAVELVPALGEVGFSSVINGPTIWTGDSLPRCGRTSVPGYYDFNSLSYGITHGPPLAEYLSALMLNGEQPSDMAAECDPLRYGDWATPEYVQAKVKETYRLNNAVGFGPWENRQGGREHLAQHSLCPTLQAQRAVLEFHAGVESAAFYDSAAQPTNTHTLHDHEWACIVEAEASAVLSGVGLAYASFSKMTVTGEGAGQFLDWVTTNDLPNKNRVKLTYALTPTGRVLAEFTITKRDVDDYYLVGSRGYADHDVQWLKDQARERFPGVTVTHTSEQVDVLHVAGPHSDLLMDKLIPERASQRFFSRKPMSSPQGVHFDCFKLSFSGEQGYELHVPSCGSVALWEELTCAGEGLGLQLFGNWALNSLRIDKGYKIKADLDWAHYTEAGA